MRSILVALTTTAALLVAGTAAANVFTLVRTSPLGEISAGDTVTYDIMYEQGSDLISLGFSVRAEGAAVVQTATHSAAQWLDYGTYAFFSPITAGYSIRTVDIGGEDQTIAGGWAWTAGAPPAFINAGLIDGAEPFNMLGAQGSLGTVTVKVDDLASNGESFTVIPFYCDTDYAPGSKCTDDQAARPGGIPLPDCRVSGTPPNCIDFANGETTEVLPEPSTVLLGGAAVSTLALLARGVRRRRS